MSEGPDEAYLEGSAAENWFYALPEGRVLDWHLINIRQVFGDSVGVRIRAATDPMTQQPSVLILEVPASPDEEENWEALLRVQEALLARRAELAITPGEDPYRRIVVSLAGPPANWPELRARILADDDR